MDKAARKRSFIPNNLPQLQNLVKRDSSAYKEEFVQQFQHYQALVELFLINPTQNSQKLQELVIFVSQVCHCYPEETATFPESIQTLLRQHGSVLHPEVRMSLCRGLILMRNKGFLQPQRVLELFFELLRCQDKALRTVLYTHIVADIKRINSRHKNNQVNKGLQNFMYAMLSDTNPVAAKMSLDVMIEMYQKNVWNDSNTVNVVTTACFSPFTKVVVGALQFFLTSGGNTGTTEDVSSEDESDGEINKALRTMVVSKQLTKKGKKRERKLAKALAKIKKRRKHKPKHPPTFSALYLINDPQSFAEKLFKKLEHSKEKFEVRLMLMSLISRLVGLHQLFLFNFYPFLQRYLQPHQHEVTKVLTFLAQASHELVPAEVLEPSIRAIVNNFITERNSSEVMTVGLNAVREICVRCPLSMTPDLLQDLADYKGYHDKSVMMAARSLIQLFRDLNPSMLKRKDRGKPVEYGGRFKIKDYGELAVSEFVPGTELVDLPSSDPEEITPPCENSMDYGDYNQLEGNDDNLTSHDELPADIVDCHNGSRRGRKRKISAVDLPSLKKWREDKAALLSQSRLFTQQEFEVLQLKQITSQVAPKRSKKQQICEMLCTQEERRQASGEILSENLIETIDHKKQKLDKEARLAVVQAGREGRQKYGYSRKRLHMHSSTTNKEKKRNKAYTMIKHKRSVRGKKKRSFREKQMALKSSLLKHR